MPEKPVVLSLDHYQAANLRSLLRVVWYCRCDQYPNLNRGDWLGEIVMAHHLRQMEFDPSTLSRRD
jgi:hypothetical protein